MSRLGSGTLIPGCFFLPPNMVGHPTGACPYGDPKSGGNIAKAKQLVQQSGMAGTPVTVWSETRSPRQQWMTYYTQFLNQIGFKATQKVIADATYFTTIGNLKLNPQTGFADWNQDFPNPIDFYLLLQGSAIQPTNNQNFGQVKDPHIDSTSNKLGATPTSQLNSIAEPVAGARPVRRPEGIRRRLRLPDLPRIHLKSDRLEQGHLPWPVRVGLQQFDDEVGTDSRVWAGTATLSQPDPLLMATTSAPGTEFSSGLEAPLDVDGEQLPEGLGPWRLAWRRLRRNKVALFFGALFLVILALCLLAPVYSHDVAHIGLADQNIDKPILIAGKKTYVVDPTGIPIGPTWHSKYFLGADSTGRDVAVRLLYGGRNSLEVGAIATVITMILALILGIVGGYFRGLADSAIGVFLDSIWAYPAVLLGIALGATLAVSGIHIWFISINGNALYVPAFVVGIVYIPYVAKPVRGQVLTLREREFVDAARQQGLSHTRIMFTEIMPNLASTIVVFVPLILANAILLEAALSFLGAGIKPPNPSWGTMISDGVATIPAAFHNVLVPGIMLVLTVMSINIFGDGLRDALDPRSKVRIAH